MKEIRLISNHTLPLKDVVFLTLREAIVKGEITAGERLMEIHLANMLGVSRTPVREAIKMLEIEGFVIIEPGKGAQVAGITEKDMRDMLDIRKALEVLSVELACRRISKEEIAALGDALEGFKAAVDNNNANEIADADVKYHDIIYKATKNKRLLNIISDQMQPMYRYRLEYIKNRDYHKSLIKEHTNIYEALKNRDIENARKFINEHIYNQEKAIMAKLNK